jgi:hypothetical protein
VMGVAYDPGNSRLEVDCLEGACLVANAGAVLQLSGGQYSWAAKSSIGQAAGARYELWVDLCGSDPAWITPTPLPTATPTNTPTVTKKFNPVNTTEPPPPGVQPSETPETPTVEPPSPEPPTAEPPPEIPTDAAGT